MKLKQHPEDFQVVELTDVVPGDQGAFTLYRLEKRGWTTPDALAVVRRRWQVQPHRLAYGGLKDRHAHTIQYFTIRYGPQRDLNQQGLQVTCLGRVGAPYQSSDILANRFRITLRAVDRSALPAALQAVEEVRADGLPNYFDDQRFGSASGSGGFVARLLVAGRYEEALRLALTGPYEYDRAGQKREKEILQRHWGDWAVCKERLPRGHARSLVDYLRVHPGDFRGALERLRPELRGLYLSAYQSHLWNRMLARWLHSACSTGQLLPIQTRLGELPFPRNLDPVQREALAAVALPLPSARAKLDPADPRYQVMRETLAEDGLTVDQMKLKGFRDLFFSKGERAALYRPADLGAEADLDENHPGQRKLVLAFELPRGCYATLLVKRVQQAR